MISVVARDYNREYAYALTSRTDLWKRIDLQALILFTSETS